MRQGITLKKVVSLFLILCIFFTSLKINFKLEEEKAVEAAVSGSYYEYNGWYYALDDYDRAILVHPVNASITEAIYPDTLNGHEVYSIGGFGQTYGDKNVAFSPITLGEVVLTFGTSSTSQAYGYASTGGTGFTTMQETVYPEDEDDESYKVVNFYSSFGTKINTAGKGNSYNYKLTKVSIPSSVKRIEPFAFMGCVCLATITGLDNVEYIGDGAFAITMSGAGKLANIINRVTTEQDYVDYTTLVLRGVTRYTSSNLAQQVAEPAITINSTNLKEIGYCAFANNDVRSINAPNVTKIGAVAFRNNLQMTSATLGDIDGLMTHTFYGTALTTFSIPATCAYVRGYALAGIDELTSVSIYNPSISIYSNYSVFSGTTSKKVNIYTNEGSTAASYVSQYASYYTRLDLSENINIRSISEPISLTVGSTSTVTVDAKSSFGNALRYQWQRSSNNSTWENISGATSSSYTKETQYIDLVESPKTYYRCVITSSTGASAISQVTYVQLVESSLSRAYEQVLIDLNTSKSKVEEYKGLVDNIKNSLSNTSILDSDIVGYINNMEATISSYESQILALNSTISNLNSRISEYNNTISNLNNKVNEYEESLENAEDNIAELEADIAELELEITGYVNQLNSAISTINDFEVYVASLKALLGLEDSATQSDIVSTISSYQECLDIWGTEFSKILDKLGIDSSTFNSYSSVSIENMINLSEDEINVIQEQLASYMTNYSYVVEHLGLHDEDEIDNVLGKIDLLNSTLSEVKDELGLSEDATKDEIVKEINDIRVLVNDIRGSLGLDTVATGSAITVDGDGIIVAIEELNTGIEEIKEELSLADEATFNDIKDKINSLFEKKEDLESKLSDIMEALGLSPEESVSIHDLIDKIGMLKTSYDLIAKELNINFDENTSDSEKVVKIIESIKDLNEKIENAEDLLLEILSGLEAEGVDVSDLSASLLEVKNKITGLKEELSEKEKELEELQGTLVTKEEETEVLKSALAAKELEAETLKNTLAEKEKEIEELKKKSTGSGIITNYIYESSEVVSTTKDLDSYVAIKDNIYSAKEGYEVSRSGRSGSWTSSTEPAIVNGCEILYIKSSNSGKVYIFVKNTEVSLESIKDLEVVDSLEQVSNGVVELETNTEEVKITDKLSNSYDATLNTELKVSVTKKSEDVSKIMYQVVEADSDVTTNWVECDNNIVISDTDSARLYIKTINSDGTATIQKTTGFKISTISKYLRGVEDGGKYNYNVTLEPTSDDVACIYVDGKEVPSGTVLWSQKSYDIVVELENGEFKQANIRIDKIAPLVEGVVDGETYTDVVIPRFGDISGVYATLNGVNILSASYVRNKGEYELIVKDGANNSRTIKFSIK